MLARGDRRLSAVIAKMVDEGAIFDAWDEHFNYEHWIASFESCGVDPDFYTVRGFGLEEVLPWDIIDAGVTKEFLLRERNNAYNEKTTPSCMEKCSACGANKLGGNTRWCKK